MAAKKRKNGRSVEELASVYAFNQGFDRGYSIGLGRNDLIRNRILLMVGNAQRALDRGNTEKAQTLLREIRVWTMRLSQKEPTSV